MISRYALYDIANISNRFSLEGLPKGIKPRYNISPTLEAPVILSENGKAVAKRMKWGLVPQGAKDTTAVFRYKTYMTTAEKVFAKHSSDSAVRSTRCIVPANGFFELSTKADKRAFYAQAKDVSLLAFAGIYRSWTDPEGAEHGTFSIITTEATSDIHQLSGRMPVILEKEDEARWIDPSVNDIGSLYSMLRPNPEGLVVMHEVGSDIHSKKINQATLVDSIK